MADVHAYLEREGIDVNRSSTFAGGDDD